MSITIGRIENKFWNNSEWKFPNTFPVYEEQMVLKEDEPNMTDFFSGTIYLYGDQWNHCYYKGGYYALQIFQTIDEDKKYYCYRLEREWWFDILIKRPRVIGDLSNSNNDVLLEANLSRTVSVIDNPARIITINFGEVDSDWTTSFVFKPSVKDLEQVVLSRDALNAFLRDADSITIKNWKKINKKFYGGNNNPVSYIFSYLKGTVTRNGWKNILRKKINDFIGSIPGNKANLKISKVQTPNNGKLVGNYCITHKTDGISTLEESSVMVEKIDLEGLTDIVPINFYDLREVEPFTPIGEGFSSGVFDEYESDIPEARFLAKIRRRPHLPLTNDKQQIRSWYEDKAHPYLVYNLESIEKGSKAIKEFLNDPFFPVSSSHLIAKIVSLEAALSPTDIFPVNNRIKEKRLKYNWNIPGPQEVRWSYRSRSGTFYSWWIDHMNFLLQFSGVDYDVSSLTERALGGWEFWSKVPSSAPRPWASWANPNPFLVTKYNVPFGFLIFGFERPFGSWRLFEYTSKEKAKKINYFSGIKGELIEYYQQDHNARGTWWSFITTKTDSIQPSLEFIRFYLDNFYLSWLTFFPNSGTYYYMDATNKYKGIVHTNAALEFDEDYWGVFAYAGWKKNLRSILVSDLYHPSTGRWSAVNPFNDDRFPSYRRHVDLQLARFLERSTLELPDGMSLEEGDYFFSDQEYSIDAYYPARGGHEFLEAVDYSLGPDVVAQGNPLLAIFTGPVTWRTDQSVPAARESFKLEDFVDGKIKRKNIFAPGDKRVVLCSNLDGHIEVRTLEVFSATQTLKTSKDQIVTSVDGVDHRASQFTILKKVATLTKLEEEFQGANNDLKEAAIHALYKLHGYKTKILEDKVSHWTWFQESDFAEASDKQLLFDLVGTDWYCFIHKGKISLIAKDKNLFSPHKGKSKRLLHNQNEGLNLSLVEKVNQKIRFQFLSAPYYLNWKTTFTDKDRISLSFETVHPTEQQTQFDQYFIKLDTGFDHVYYENVAVPKKQSKAVSLADSVNIERLNLELVRDQYSYRIDQDKLKLATDRYEESIKRAQIELDHQRLEAFMSLGMNSFTGSVATGIAARHQKDWKRVRIKRGHKTVNFQGMQMDLPTEDITTLTKYNKMPNMAAGAMMFAGNRLKNMIMDFGYHFPERQRQINVDKQIGASELAIQSLAMNTSHMERQLNAQLALNQVSNVYKNPIINEREIIEKFMEKADWHGGKKLNDAYLMVFVPSEEQLVQLRSYKEEYGVMCDIPDVEIIFYDGMPADVIRYRNLDDGSILGIDNSIIREAFRARLLAGLKIVQTASYSYRLLTSSEYLDRIYRLNNDLYESTEKVKVKSDENVKLIQRLNVIEGELKAKHTSEKAQLTERIAEIENQLNNVNKQLREKIDELNKAKTQCEKDTNDLTARIKSLEAEKAALRDRIQECTENTEELTQKLNDERRLVLNKTDEINNLKKQKENLENQKADIERQLQEALKQKADLEAKKKQLEADVSGAKQDLDIAKTKPIFTVDLCKFIREMAYDSRYEIDMKERKSGLSAFTDLTFEISHNLKWMRLSRSDQVLSGKYPEIRKLITDLNSLSNINPMPYCEREMQKHTWSHKQDLLLGLMASDQDREKEEFDRYRNADDGMTFADISGLLSKARWLSNLHAFKKGIDKTNMTLFEAYEKLKGKFDEDPDLDHFFKHFYPGQRVKALYKALFDIDMEFTLVQREFLKNDCAPSDGPPVDLTAWIDRAKKQFAIEVKQAGQSELKVPPTTNTIYFSDGGNLFIEEGKDYRYIKPSTSGLPYYTYYSYADNKLQRSGIRGKALKEFSFQKETYYYRGDKYWTWCKFRTEGFDSREPTGYTSGTGHSSSIYFRVARKGIMKEVDDALRLFLSYQFALSFLKVLQSTKKSDSSFGIIDGDKDLIRKFVIRNWDYYNADSPEDASGVVSINLTKTFGKIKDVNGIRDDVKAWYVLGVLDANKTWISKRGEYDDLPAYELTGRFYGWAGVPRVEKVEGGYIPSDTGVGGFILEYFNEKNRNINVIGENMFVDLRALMSYVLKIIKTFNYVSVYPKSFRDFTKKVENLTYF